MARYRILGWREIPSLVEAFDDEGREVRRPLSQRFQDLIDSVAMREGAADTESYLEGWAHGPDQERTGSPEEIAEAVAAELEEGFADLAARRLTSPSR